jgi:hypothetical protein
MRFAGLFPIRTLASLLLICQGLPVLGQQSVATTANPIVPPLVRFSGVLTDVNGKPLTGVVGVTFFLYKDSEGGAPLWMETENVQPNQAGHYSVMLGSTTSQGLPFDLFVSGEARWLGVQAQGQSEQPRVLLLSVPYALKAGDAETVGGLPPSAFVLATPAPGAATAPSGGTNSGSAGSAPAASTITGSGTVNFLPLWTGTSTIGNSVLFQSGTGSTAKVGINTSTPASTLDVKGAGTIRGLLSLPAAGTATATAGANSQPLDLAAAAFNSSTAKAQNETFQWQAEPTRNNTSTPSGTLNLLFGSGTSKPVETGLKISNTGIFTFAAGQTFPGTGNGTITSVTAGTDLTGGGTGGNVTVNLDTTKVPQLNASNTFTGNQTVNGNVNATGLVTGSAFQIGSNLFDYGSYANRNVFLGFAGNTTMTGVGNTGTGWMALGANTTGESNVAVGAGALSSNTTGYNNTANGVGALSQNTTGFQNTAVGLCALCSVTTASDNTAVGAAALDLDTTGATNVALGWESLGANTTGSNNTAAGPYSLELNTTGSYNTAFGMNAGVPTTFASTTGSNNTFLGSFANPGAQTALNNATAIGANTQVTTSNAMVLGSINGVNGATADTNVGIGTTAPQTLFHIDHAAQPGVGTDVAEITSGGSIDVASLLLKNTGSGGFRLRVGAGTGSGYLASSGPMAFITADTGSPSFPSSAAMTIDNSGNVHITGNLSKGGGSFKIDHPLDPANKYLYHSFVESPDMMNVYNGNVVTNQHGLATVVLPDYFEALNRDFRYQLTVIGQFAQAIVAKEISRNRFTIRTDKPSVKVSWQVTGIRHDGYADAHRIPVEEEKSPQEQGRYLHPELFGASPEQAIGTRLPLPTPTGDASGRPMSRLATEKEKE